MFSEPLVCEVKTMNRYSTIPVGMTPINRYASWTVHRDDIHQDCLYQLRKRSYRSPTMPVET
jgi:hypothetical protein